MTFAEMRLSLQLLAEEEIGAPRWRSAKDARDAEDAAWARALPKDLN